MIKERIEQLYPLLNSGVTGYRNEWVLGRCPLVWKHGGKDIHPSFGIKASTKNKSICKCWSCGYGGDLQDLVMDIRMYLRKNPLEGYDLKSAVQLISHELDDIQVDPSSISDYDKPIVSPIIIFPEEWFESFPSVLKFKDGYSYLLSRNVPRSMMQHLDIRYDPMQKRVCFPYRDAKGRLLGVQGRSIEKESTLRYFQYGYKGQRNGSVWMGEDKVDFDKPVVLVEGPLDYTSVMRVYPNVMASFTSGLSAAKMKRVSVATELVTLYDYGNGGSAARAAIDKHLGKVPKVHLIPTQEQDDAGAMELSEVRDILEPHVKLVDYNDTWINQPT